MDSLAERLSYKRAGGSRSHHKENRLSKLNIGQPIKIPGNAKSSETADSNDSSATPSMVMKAVVVQKDEKGYGLTVSGDNPVCIQSVKSGGAAAKAGVVQGDKILKVNGSKVTDLNHVEVVKLIKAGSYVALTLLGGPAKSSSETPTSSTPTPPSEVASSPQVRQHCFHDEKVETIKKMLEHETSEVERIKEEYAMNPEPNILKKLGVAQKLKQDLEKQLWKIEGMLAQSHNDSVEVTVISSDVDYEEPTETTEDKEGLDSDDSDDTVTDEKPSSSEAVKSRRGPSINELPVSGPKDFLPDSASPIVMGPHEHTRAMDPPYQFEQNNPFLVDLIQSAEDTSQEPERPAEIMNFEDDDIVNNDDEFQDHGPFGDLDKLRQRPAHLAVFFNYVLSSHEPGSFLFTASVDSYKQLSSSKEMVKHGEAIYRTFLSPSAIYKVSVDEGITSSIHSALSSKSSSEETLRGVFDPAVQAANKEIRIQLSEYRRKRVQGLGSLFGDEKLQNAIHMENQSSDNRLVDDIIQPTLIELQKSSNDDTEQARINVKQEVLQSFLSQYGTKRPRGKTSSRIYSILRPNKPPPINRGRFSMSMESVVDDQNNNKKGGMMGGIFGGTKKKPNSDKSKSSHEKSSGNSRRDKTKHTLKENPSNKSSQMKPPKVSTSASTGQLSSLASVDVVDGSYPADSKSPERRHEPVLYHNSAEASMPHSKSMPFSTGTVPQTHTGVIQPPPQIFEPVLNDPGNKYGNPFLNQDDENVADNSESLFVNARSRPSRSGSFRQQKDSEKRNSNSHKSHSDPDKVAVEQVVQNSSSSESSEHSGRHFSVTDGSLSSLGTDERKYMEQLPTFVEDVEIDIDSSKQHWSESVPKSVSRDLDKKETKRQQVINELIYTEQHHVRDLKILEKLFYEPLESEKILSPEELNQAFPNLKDVLSLHRELNKALQERKERDGHVIKEIGDILLARFDGDGGKTFKEDCAMYCGNQSTVLSLINEKMKKDTKFNQFVQAAQRHPVCRKLSLKDFIPTEFQRLTKYPLLLENIIKNTKKKQENEKVRKACERCREILAFVNQAVKEAEDKQKIIEIQQNLDRDPILKLKNPSKVTEEFKHIDLTERPSILQGPLSFRIGQMDKRKELPLHCILYDDVFVLLHKQDERYILKCHGTSQGDKSSGGSHSPFLPMDKLIVRNKATDKRAFFVMSTSGVGPQMYEFVAASTSVKKQWMELMTETAKKKESEVPSSRRRAFVVPGTSRDGDGDQQEELAGPSPAGRLIGRADDNHHGALPMNPHPDAFASGISKSYFEAKNLTEKIVEAHQVIQSALAKKHRYLAEMAGLAEQDLESVLDMSAADQEPDPSILIKSAVLSVDKLTGMLNDCAMHDNTFVRKRTYSQPDQSSSIRFSMDIAEADYQSESDQSAPVEKWAIHVANHERFSSNESPLSPEESSSTLHSVSDLPLSGSEPSFSEGETSPSKRPLSDHIMTASQDGQYPYPAATSESAQSVYTTLSKAAEAERYFQADGKRGSAITDDSVSEASKSRPQSGIELCAHVGMVPIKEMMDMVISLQTQLTQLMHVTQESETDRQRLRAENQQLRDELRKMQNDEPPDYYEMDQESAFDPPTASANTKKPNIRVLHRDVELLRRLHRSCPAQVESNDRPHSTSSISKQLARRSTGF